MLLTFAASKSFILSPINIQVLTSYEYLTKTSLTNSFLGVGDPFIEIKKSLSFKDLHK